MANLANSVNIGPLVLRAQADGLFNANDVAQRIENMYLLEESTLRSVWGPTAFVPDTSTGERPFSRGVPAGLPDIRGISATTPVYGFKQHGIFHCELQEGGRDVLLLHSGTELWEFQGWSQNWRKLLSKPAEGHGIQAELLDEVSPQFPTQFVPTGNGVVIVPQGSRAYFYDGHCIAPLGFSEIPPSPVGRGPASSGEKLNVRTLRGVNDIGYAHSSSRTEALLTFIPDSAGLTIARTPDSPMTQGFGKCRLGNTTTLPTSNPDNIAKASAGWLEPGEWRAAVQYVDRWGNLSPVSAESSAVTCDQHPAIKKVYPYLTDTDDENSSPESVSPTRSRVQIKWTGISQGPDHCIGRRLYRTKDLESGAAGLFLMTQNAMSTTTAFATLPDNVVTQFPDNIPDTWLGAEAPSILRVPQFKLAEMALGRLWIGNLIASPGTARPSDAGFWGTFTAGRDVTPDPQSEIMGMKSVQNGLLLCTEDTTFLVTASNDGQRFRHSPLSTAIGCVAPSSMKTMAAGQVVWMGRDGFYAYEGGKISFVSPQLRRLFKRVTQPRMRQAVATYDSRSREYRCWVSLDGSKENQTCFVFDGSGWRTRLDVVADSVCTTKDHRQYTFVGGHIPGDVAHSGVYLLDHDASPDIPEMDEVKDREALVETGWLEAGDSDKAKTSYVVYLWLRETENTAITIDVLKNWREKVIETNTTKRYSEKDVPDFWATTKLGSGTWRDKRPFWTRAAIHVPSAESVKFRIRGTGVWEFVGLQVEMAPRYYSGAQLAP